MHNLGVVLNQLGETAKAEQWWRRAAISGSREAMNNLGVLLRAR